LTLDAWVDPCGDQSSCLIATFERGFERDTGINT